MPDDDFLVRATTHSAATWWFRHVASKLDPVLFKLTNGRVFSMGMPTMPMATLTMQGRKTGRRRSIHLAAIEHDGHFHVVASAWGQQAHPAWRYNLEANPAVEVQLPGKRFRAIAELLNAAEKAAIWPGVCETIPQMRVYERRTQREFSVFRLRPAV